MANDDIKGLREKLNTTHDMVVKIHTVLTGMNGGGLIKKVEDHDRAIKGMTGPQWFMKIFVIALIAAGLTFAFSFITPAHPQEFWDTPQFQERLYRQGRYIMEGTPTMLLADINQDGQVTPLDASWMIAIVYKGWRPE